MKNKGRQFTIIGILLTVVLITVWGILVYRVNQKIPQVQTEVTEAHEWFQWKNDVRLRTEGVRFMEDAEIRSLYPLEQNEMEPFPGIMLKLMWVTISFKNDGNETADIDILDIGASTSGWSNIPDFDFYYKIGNPEREHHFELAPKEEITMELPYLFAEPNFRNGQWEKIEEKEYSLVVALYPVKRMIKIPKVKLS